MSYKCYDCPRNCGAIRDEYTGTGFCKMGEKIAVAKVMTHMWEEPLLSGSFSDDTYKGTENIFLYGCNLGCIFCQNRKISGKCNEYDKSKISYYTPFEFGNLLIEASKTSANNIGIVSGDHYIRQIAEAITPEVKAKINKPIIFNCNGYEKPEELLLLKDKIDIFMPDFKYADSLISIKYSFASDYFEVSKVALKTMFSIVGMPEFDENGLLRKGVLIRHLIMPGNISNTIKVIDYINENYEKDQIIFSLMSQYTPISNDFEYKELTRPISHAEKKKAVSYLDASENITLYYTQEDGTVSESFIPDF